MSTDSSSEVEDSRNIFSIPWEDILYQNVLPHLSIKDIFSFRSTCTSGIECIDGYFVCMKSLVLNTTSKTKFNSEVFHLMTKDCKQLENLVIRHANTWLSDNVVKPVLEKNKKIKHFDFSGCSTITNSLIQCIAVSHINLESLVLSDCHWLSSAVLLTVAMNCTNLKKLDIAGCWDVDNDTLMTICSLCEQ